jgi:hypothetical protein
MEMSSAILQDGNMEYLPTMVVTFSTSTRLAIGSDIFLRFPGFSFSNSSKTFAAFGGHPTAGLPSIGAWSSTNNGCVNRSQGFDISKSIGWFTPQNSAHGMLKRFASTSSELPTAGEYCTVLDLSQNPGSGMPGCNGTAFSASPANSNSSAVCKSPSICDTIRLRVINKDLVPGVTCNVYAPFMPDATQGSFGSFNPTLATSSAGTPIAITNKPTMQQWGLVATKVSVTPSSATVGKKTSFIGIQIRQQCRASPVRQDHV